MRKTLIPLVLVLAALAGCIGGLDGELDPADAEAASPLPANATLSWSAQEERTDELVIPTPNASIGALHVSTEATAEEPDSSITASIVYPNGSSYETAQASSASVEGWEILPGFEGSQGALELHIEATGPAQIRSTVHFDDPHPELESNTTRGPDHPVVVAVVDTGINPYHDVFQREGMTTETLPDRIQEADSGEDPLTLPVDQRSTYTRSLQHDAAAWTHVPDNRLIHFEGTNVLGYELRDRELPQLPVIDRSGHGTSVAHAVVEENPDAIVTMITASNYDDGVQWAAKQPWIDLISLSWGPSVNAAGAAEPHASGFRTYDVTQTAHQEGKLVFTATGNDPTLAFTDTTSGPPWVHAVSGAEPDANGRAILSGNLVDTVANWTQTLASYDSTHETSTGSGTSFATPTTAGIASKILYDLRIATGHDDGITEGAMVDADVTVTTSDLRHALNRTAEYWETTDYQDPTAGPSLPAAPAPWANMGWGYLDGSAVAPAVDGLLGNADLPDKADEAQAFMDANLEIRKTWWHDFHQGER